jgi:L-asparaginase
MKNKILLIFTGGTICSFYNADNVKSTDTSKAKSLIEENFRKKNNTELTFEYEFPYDILSENVTVCHWNALLDTFRKCNTESYDGIIVLHGTDTLAYSANLLSVALSSYPLPVFLVSSPTPLADEGSFGNDNFDVAVKLILNGVLPNVYVPYKNSDGKTYVHLGKNMLQCKNFSDDFFGGTELSDFKGEKNEGEYVLDKMKKLTPSVIKIDPYASLDYSRIKLSGIRAVVHGTYHSETLSMGNISRFSARRLFSKKRVVFLAPCTKDTPDFSYDTTATALALGAVPVSSMSSDMVYVKALVGVSLGYRGNELKNFVKR